MSGKRRPTVNARKAGFSKGKPSRSRLIQRYSRPFIGVAVAAVALAAILHFASPFAAQTAVDSSGREVKVGPVASVGAAPRQAAAAPGFVLPDYEGKAVSLESYKGKVVLLNFWATWCTVCEAEMPDMVKLAKNHPDDLVVLAVDRGESVSQAKNWTDARRLTNIQFAVDSDESVARAYRLPNSMPNSYFINPEGVITRVIPGGQSLSTMERYYREALGSASPPR